MTEQASASAQGSGPATRAALLDATRACLEELGPAGTTSRAITTRAGANLAAITYHFGSKDALVAEALLASVRHWLEPVLTVLRSDDEPTARTVRAVAALQSSLAQARATLPLHLGALVAAPHNPALRAGLDELLREVHGLLAAQIADQVASGYLPPWVAPEAMAHLLVALADGIALHAVLQPDVVDPDELIAQALALLLAARAGSGVATAASRDVAPTPRDGRPPDDPDDPDDPDSAS